MEKHIFSPGKVLVLPAIAFLGFLFYVGWQFEPVSVQVHYWLGSGYACSGYNAEARLQYGVSLQIAREYVKKAGSFRRQRHIRQLCGLSAVGLAEIARRSGDAVSAERLFRLGAAFGAANAAALDGLGLVAFERKDTRLARFFFERSLKIRPGFGPAWDNLKKTGY
jgi:hypothetical protein